MRAPRLPISIKLLFLLSGMAALAIGLALAMQDRALASDLRGAAAQRLDRAGASAELLIEQHLELMRERYRAVSGTPQFRASIEVGDAPTLGFYARSLAAREGAAAIAFLDDAGEAVAASGDASLLGHGSEELVAREGRLYAAVSVPLSTAGDRVGTLVAAEEIPADLLRTWSTLCGAELVLAAPGERHTADLMRPVRRATGQERELRVVSSMDSERGALDHSRLNLLTAGVVALALAFLSSVFLARSMVRPIIEIQAAAERISSGDYGVRTHSARRDEIGDVARAFDAMLARIQRNLLELQRSQTNLENAQRMARIGSWRFDLDANQLTGSAVLHSILGQEGSDPEKPLPIHAVVGGVHPEDRDAVESAVRGAVEHGTSLRMEYRFLVAGEERIFHTQAQVKPADESGGRRLEGTIQDVTDRRRTEEQIRYLAYHDSLTGLGNRSLFVERLGLAISHARRNQTNVGVLFLDLDQFKRINDTLGHSVGDLLLQRVADRMVSVVRDSDLVSHHSPSDSESAVSRLGGDEFTFLVPDVKDPRDLAKIARRILSALSERFDLQGHEVVIGGSIGITAWPIDGQDVESLLRNADTAMYHAKDQGRNNYQFYTESMNAASLRRLTLEQKLRRALDEEEFELHYQPKVSLDSGEVRGFEALLRWRDPEAGLVMPGDFIEVAEETGLIVPIGEWALRSACQQLLQWRSAGMPPRPVAVNVSARQFRSGGLVATLEQVVAETGIEPELLEIEITESTLLAEGKATIAALEALRARGIRVAIDDFGTGYSSLSYLRRLPVDTLKIDRSFVQHIESDQGDASVAAAIVSMGRALRLKLVAEGVETPAQRDLLGAWGCDEFQGFVFSPAVPAREVEARWKTPGGSGLSGPFIS